MEFIKDPFQTESDRPDYANLCGPVNCQLPTVTELTSGIGSEDGGSPTFLRKEPCVQAEEIYPETIVPAVINQSVPDTKVKAAAASVETARKEEIKAQADEPIQNEGNGVTTESGQAGKKKGGLLGMLYQGFLLLVAAGWSLVRLVQGFFLLVADVRYVIEDMAARARLERALEEIEAQADEPIQKEGNGVTTESGQAGKKKGGLLGRLDQGFLLVVAAGWLLGMLDPGFLLLVAAGWSLVRLVQGFLLLVAAACHLIEVAKFKFVLRLGVLNIEVHF